MKKQAGHTPGPWQIGASRQDAKDAFFWHVDILNRTRSTRIARVAGVGKDSAEANACLIAAAPDMLSALKIVKAWFENPGAKGEVWPLPQVNRVIAKAEGQG